MITFLDMLQEEAAYKQRKNSLFEDRQVKDILSDLGINSFLYEISINTDDSYEYTKKSIPGLDSYEFVDKNGLVRAVIFNTAKHEVKVGWRKKEDTGFRHDKPDSELADDKVLNTFAKVVLDVLIPQHNIILLKCVDELRFRFFRALIYQNLSKEEYNVATQGNDILIQKKDSGDI